MGGSPGCCNQAFSVLQDFVHSFKYEQCTVLVILANAITLGLETDYQATKQPRPYWLNVSEIAFCVLFTVELLLRLCVYRLRFFYMQGYLWNLFDMVIVTLQLIEVFSTLSSSEEAKAPVSVKFFRVLRLLRVLRVTRIMRLVEELRTISASIIGSMRSLFWTLVLILMIIFGNSIFFTQVVLFNGDDSPQAWKLKKHFGRLPVTMLTMFEAFTGGISWNEVIEPLNTDISPLVGIIFVLYIAFCTFAMLNVVTGVFVEKAMTFAREDEEATLMNKISEAFMTASDQITMEEFCSILQTDAMQDYFKQIKINPSDSQGLFWLLDVDGSGCVDASEIVAGCLRLRGEATAFDLALLMNELIITHKHLVAKIQDLNGNQTPHSIDEHPEKWVSERRVSIGRSSIHDPFPADRLTQVAK